MVESSPAGWPAWLGELAVVGGCIAAPTAELFVHAGTGSGGTDVLVVALMVAGAVALPLRHRHPVLVTVVCGSCTVAAAVAGDRSPAVSVSSAVALYSVGVAGLRLWIVVAVTLAACAAFVVGLLIGSGRTMSAHDLLHAASVMAPVIGGRLVAMQRLAAALRIERVELAIRAERDLLQLRIEQERRRIARDLHDAVGHALTTITVQAGVAARLLDTRPAFARDALLEISVAGGEALRDLRSVVGVLRRSDADTADGSGLPAEGSPVEEEPCLDDLAVLLDRIRGNGVDVGLTIAGSAEVPRSVQVAVYRVVQEALTNVRKHAGEVPAEVEIVMDGLEVCVRVGNLPGARPELADRHRVAVNGAVGQAVGTGLMGMRERVTLLGGCLDAGPTASGGFEVRARIPLPTAAVSESTR